MRPARHKAAEVGAISRAEIVGFGDREMQRAHRRISWLRTLTQNYRSGRAGSTQRGTRRKSATHRGLPSATKRTCNLPAGGLGLTVRSASWPPVPPSPAGGLGLVALRLRTSGRGIQLPVDSGFASTQSLSFALLRAICASMLLRSGHAEIVGNWREGSE